MALFLFSPTRIAELRRRGQIAATLLLPSQTINVREQRIYGLYREYVVHDADGQSEGVQRERVQDVADQGLKPAVVTVLHARQVEVYEAAGLAASDARACGYNSVSALRKWWSEQHPRSPLATLTYFALGDIRDRDRFLQRGIWRGGDYTRDRHYAIDPLPSLTEDQLSELAVQSRQHGTRKQVEQAQLLADQPLEERVARLEAVGTNMRAEIRHELHIIGTRATRGLRRLKP